MKNGTYRELARKTAGRRGGAASARQVQGEAERLSLQRAIESFFRSSHDLAPKTARWYRQNLSDFVRFLQHTIGGEPTLADLNKVRADAFLAERIAKPTRKYPHGSPFAARAASVTLKRFASYLAQEGILADELGNSVLTHVRRARVDDHARQPLSDAQLERVLQAAGYPGERDHAVVLLMAGSGVRLSEARLARISDLDLDAGTIRVRPETSKFGRERVIYMHPAVAATLDRYLRVMPFSATADGPLFPTRSGRTFDENGWAKVFSRIRRRSGVRAFCAHALRHTWATNFMRAPGASVLELKRQGGWERWEMVERYSHAVPVRDRLLLPNPSRFQWSRKRNSA